MATHVVLFGWMGAHRRHVDKYAAMYESAEGMTTTVAVASPVDIMLIRRNQLIEFGVDVLRQVSERAAEGSPIAVHCFSNGGVFVWNFLLRLAHDLDPAPPSLSEEDIGLVKRIIGRVVAEVFDSAPCYLLLRSGVSAIDVALANNAVARIGLKSAFLFFAVSAALINQLRGLPAEPELYWDRCTSSPCTARQLYIYSDADPICDVPSLERLIDQRASRKIDVTRLHLQTSGHVAHYREQPERYRDACLRHCTAP